MRKLAERLERAGFETWTVGGAVRDALRGRPGEREDWDLATRATPAQMRRVFRRTVPLGPQHGTLGVFGVDGVMYEVTTFRRDVATDGRRAVVAFAETVEEDLARRDFTVNAMAWHPKRRELCDPYGGLADLEARVLRAVGSPAERFREDYLRVLRGLRFAGAMGLQITDGTWEGLVAAVPGLGRLSRERIRDEVFRLLSGPNRAGVLELYQRSGALRAVLPELGPLDARAMSAVARAKRHRPLAGLALLLLAGLRASGRSGADPDEDVQAAQAIMRRLRLSRAHSKRVAAAVRGGTGPTARVTSGAPARRRWVAETGTASLPDVFRVWIAACRAGLNGFDDSSAGGELLRVIRAVRRDLHRGVPASVEELAVGGKELLAQGWLPGPPLGSVLQQLLRAVWEDPSLNERATLLAIAEAVKRNRTTEPNDRARGS